MKKIILVLLILAIVGGAAFAFDPLSYPTSLGGGGSFLIDTGIGFWYTNYPSHYGKLSIPPLFLNVEYTLPVNFPISVGGGVSFSQWKFDRFQFYDYTQTFITPLARVNWHWGFDISWLDLYTGVSAGWTQVSTVWGRSYGGSITPAGKSGFYVDPHVGAHFYFTDFFGAVVEAGYPFLVKGGVTLKLGGNPAVGRTASRNTARGMGTASVTTDVNLRSGPSLDYPVIIALPQGSVVTLTGEIVEGWTQVIYNGTRGWISSPYLNTRL